MGLSLPLEGSCVCTAIKFCITHEPLFTHACHCFDCQKTTGSAFAMSMFLREGDVELVDGEPLVVTIPAKRGTRQATLCPSCQTLAWVTSTDGEGLVIVRPGVLANKSDIAPDAHIWVHRKQAWLELPGDVPCFEGSYERETTWPQASLNRLATQP